MAKRLSGEIAYPGSGQSSHACALGLAGKRCQFQRLRISCEGPGVVVRAERRGVMGKGLLQHGAFALEGPARLGSPSQAKDGASGSQRAPKIAKIELRSSDSPAAELAAARSSTHALVLEGCTSDHDHVRALEHSAPDSPDNHQYIRYIMLRAYHSDCPPVSVFATTVPLSTAALLSADGRGSGG